MLHKTNDVCSVPLTTMGSLPLGQLQAVLDRRVVRAYVRWHPRQLQRSSRLCARGLLVSSAVTEG
jgi:hypothetical protein